MIQWIAKFFFELDDNSQIKGNACTTANDQHQTNSQLQHFFAETIAVKLVSVVSLWRDVEETEYVKQVK